MHKFVQFTHKLPAGSVGFTDQIGSKHTERNLKSKRVSVSWRDSSAAISVSTKEAVSVTFDTTSYFMISSTLFRLSNKVQ